jgi:hypothetical protein
MLRSDIEVFAEDRRGETAAGTYVFIDRGFINEMHVLDTRSSSPDTKNASIRTPLAVLSSH